MAMRKLISLGGSTALPELVINDYLRLSNRADILATGTKWVRIWVSWHDLAQKYGPPSSLAQSWAQLNAGVPGYPASDRAGLRRIDAQIRRANADGLGVILVVEHAFPLWTNPPTTPPRGKAPEWRPPKDVTVNSPFGWFIGHLCARYKPNLPRNPKGPQPGGPFGNPDAAYINALEVCNEPNQFWWPHYERSINRTSCTAALMLQTAEEYAFATRWPPLLGPGTADTSRGLPNQLPYDQFTREVLGLLQNWRPRVFVGWSHHNYADIASYSTKRVARVRDLLEQKRWHDSRIWITEGGYDRRRSNTGTNTPEAERAQARHILETWKKYQAFSDANARAGRKGVIYTFAQHPINDQTCNVFKSGLRKEVNCAKPTTIPPKRCAYDTWHTLKDQPCR